jgi:hypothetical protein
VAKQLREIRSAQDQHEAATQRDLDAIRQDQATLLKEVAQLKAHASAGIDHSQQGAPAAKRSRRLIPDVMSQSMFTALTTATAEPMDALFFSQS